MADARLKRIPGFIKPFRVEPGRRVRLPHDFDPAGTREVSVKEAKEILRFGRRAPRRLPDASCRPGHLRRRDGPPGDGRGRQGRHDPPRHERRQPAGRPGQQLQDPVERGARPRLPVALPEEAARSAATSASSTAPTTRRSSSSASTPRSWPARSCRRSSRTAASGSAASARSTTGSATSPTRATASSRSSSTSRSEEQRRRFLARIDEPDKNWKFSANDAKERAYWNDYQKAFSEVLSNTSTPWAPWYVIPADDKPFARVAAAGDPGPHADRDRPALPEGRRRRRKAALAGGQGRARGPGARGLRRGSDAKPRSAGRRKTASKKSRKGKKS